MARGAGRVNGVGWRIFVHRGVWLGRKRPRRRVAAFLGGCFRIAVVAAKWQRRGAVAEDRPLPAGRRGARPASLAVWMTASVAVFVLLGSLALVLVFQRWIDHEEKRAFEELARANAGFLERAHLPMSGKMAGQLGELIGARVFFWRGAGGQVVGAPGEQLESTVALETACDGKAHRLPDGDWMVGVVAQDGTRVIFLRPPPARVLALIRADTWGALVVFWLLSLGLGMGLARRVTRPLRSLAESLPLVGTEQALPDLPVTRRDEIGQLARTLRRTHESLRDERERRRAAERHALLGRMASNLAHEVRNPVAAIRLHAQLLDGAQAEDAATSRRLIESEAARIEGLVGQWLSHAKPAPPVLVETDVVEVLRQAVQVMEPQARHAGVVVRLEAGEVERIAADRHRLQQVFGNLLLNAVQAMPRGGRVTVRVAEEAARVVVVFEDEGPGFSVSALSGAGEPFYSEREGGMGLGLAVAKDICEAHGGGLEPGNGPAGGARVTVWLAKSGPVTAGREREC